MILYRRTGRIQRESGGMGGGSQGGPAPASGRRLRALLEIGNEKENGVLNGRLKRTAAALCAAGLLFTTYPALTAAAYDDFEEITSHVDLAVPQTLDITKPDKDITTSAAHYYIMGNSDPNQDLYLNGQLITTRGSQGSFGVYVDLAYGRNLVEFSQGNQTEQVIITRSDSAQVVSTTTVASRMFPTYDTAFFAGDTVRLSCVAPAGGSVTATVNGASVRLSQAAAAMTGVPATFYADIVMPEADGTVSLGNVVYTLTYNGKTTQYTSAGELFTSGTGSPLLVQVTQVSSLIINDAKNAYITTGKLGAMDEVVDMNDDQYRLSSGGWISRANVRPLAGYSNYHNQISAATFTTEDRGERFVLTGTSNPIAITWQSSEKLYVELNNTSGLASLSVEGSRLFTDASVTQKGNNTVIELYLSPSAALWGYAVEYDQGVTSIYCKYRPTLSGDASRPLQGIVVALDAGHGTKDPGALGMSQLKGPTESDITYATTVAVKKRLESLGATVIFPEPPDLNSRFNERMQPGLDAKADLFISLHCNSIVENANGLTPNGIEIYYYEAIGKPLGSALIGPMTSYTGRNSRGVKYYEFRVTLNSYAPSVLVEMGFMTNPVEYDDMCSKTGIFRMANAVGDGVISFLS